MPQYDDLFNLTVDYDSEALSLELTINAMYFFGFINNLWNCS